MFAPVHRWRIGRVEVARVGELVLALPAAALLPDLTDDHVAGVEWLAPYASGGELTVSFHTFVITAGDRTIVVDTCIGDRPGGSTAGDPTFPDRLAGEIAGGLGAVDTVLCTHLHFDHVGWHTRTVDGVLVPTFPNARYLVARTELETMGVDDPHAIMDTKLRPVLAAGLVDAVDTDHAVSAEVRLVPTPGHTPGHVSALVESVGERAIITGDAFHSPVQFLHPDIAATNYDSDSDASRATRRRFVAEHVGTGTLVLGTHFPPPTAGRLERDGDAGGRAAGAGGQVRFAAGPEG